MQAKTERRLKKINNWLDKYLALVFLGVALIIGGTIVFRLQPLFGNDEIVHFPRAFQIQQGQFWEEQLSERDYGGQVPKQIKEFNDGFREQVQSNRTDPDKLADLQQRYMREKVEGSKTEPLTFTSAGVYSPWAYFPAAAGVWFARILHLPIVWYVYLGRLMCLLVWTVLVYLALKIMPNGKLFLFAAALLPTSLVQAGTIGMDGIVNGLSWLIIAYSFAILAQKVIMTKKELITVGILCLLLATTKQGYLLIAALPLIIPPKLYPLSRKASQIVRASFAGLLGIATIWYLSVTSTIAGIIHLTQRPTVYVDGGAQLHHVFTHPFSVLVAVFAGPFSAAYGGIYAGLVGVLTNKLIFLPIVLIGLLYLGLILAFIESVGDKALAAYKRLIVISNALAVVVTFFLINLALYVTFTKVGNARVEGVQGRYLLPLLPLLLGFRAVAKKPLLPKLSMYIPVLTTGITLTGLLITLLVIA